MSPTALACLTGLLATVILVYLLSPVARRIGLVDIPRAHKTHEGRVPLVGGLAMFCGFLFAVLVLPASLAAFRPLFAGLALLVIVGLLDDFRELGPNSRLVAQIGAGLIMVFWGGLSIATLGPLIGDWELRPGLVTVPFTVFAVVGVINAMNMQDGIDGLAGAQALIAFSTLAWTAFSGGATTHGVVLLVLASVTIGFLAFNLRLPGRPRAMVFMGDAGSMFLGFALAWFVVDLSQPPDRTLAPVTALWILAVPLLDTVCILLRRMARGRSPFLADREHLHHLLQAAGFSVAGSVILVMIIAACLAVGGLAAQYLGVPDRYMFAAFLILFALYAAIMDLSWRRLGCAHDLA